MTEKQIDILAKILTALTIILIILCFKYILAIAILFLALLVYMVISIF